MPVFQTRKGHEVPHCHIGDPSPCAPRDYTPSEAQDQRVALAAVCPNAIEVAPPTLSYNCHGFAYVAAQGWVDSATLFVQDDFSPVAMSEAQPGDVLIYKKTTHGRILHSAVVEQVVNHKIQVCRSKMGGAPLVLHDPKEVPKQYYGRPWRLLRRKP